MAYQRKVWQNRVSEFFNRYRMQRSSGQTEDVFLTLNDGAVIQEGDSLTSEQLNDLEARIQYGFETSGGIGNCNPNLLDNPWFTVNQRGFDTTSDSTMGYHFDRWYGNYNYDADGMKLENSKVAKQYLAEELKNSLDGKTVIFAVMYSDGVIASGSIEYEKSPEEVTTIFQDENVVVSIDTNGNIAVEGLQSCVIRVMKLEVGEISTVAYDSPANLAVETAKCRASTADATDVYTHQPMIHNSAYNAVETGMYSQAIGSETTASGDNSHAEGIRTQALGDNSHVEGYKTIASGNNVHAEGQNNIPEDFYQQGEILRGFSSTQFKSEWINSRKGVADLSDLEELQRISHTKGNGINDVADNANAFDFLGNMFLAGAPFIRRGIIEGQLIATSNHNFVLEPGAMYMLFCWSNYISSGAWRGMNSYMIAANHGIATSTSAQRGVLAQFNAQGTVGVTIEQNNRTVSYTWTDPITGTTALRYGYAIGLGSCTTDCRVRYALVKVLGSYDDFSQTYEAGWHSVYPENEGRHKLEVYDGTGSTSDDHNLDWFEDKVPLQIFYLDYAKVKTAKPWTTTPASNYAVKQTFWVYNIDVVSFQCVTVRSNVTNYHIYVDGVEVAENGYLNLLNNGWHEVVITWYTSSTGYCAINKDLYRYPDLSIDAAITKVYPIKPEE